MTLDGIIDPFRSNMSIALQMQYEGGLWTALSVVDTDTDGRYSYSWQPSQPGTYKILAHCPEDATYRGSTSSLITFTENKLSCSISCDVPSSEVVEGTEVTVSGSLNPAMADQIVTLTYTKPDSSTVTRSVTTSADGSFSDTFSPEDVGSWSVMASWNGDATYQESSSTPRTLIIAEQSLQISPIAIGIPIVLGLIAVIVIIIRRQ